MRHSVQRDLIYDTVMSSCDHPSAEMIFERVRLALPAVSLGTVYRNLNALAEEGAILRIGIADGKDRYDKTTCTHAHHHCRVCGRVTDFGQLDAFDAKVKSVGEECGCRVESCNIVVTGLCADCAKR